MTSEKRMESLDDMISIVDDAAPAAGAIPVRSRAWRVLIVDDDEDVHSSTRFALSNVMILDRPLELIHAHSVEEAHARLVEYPDIAVALIDVVMETPDAGLRLVREIREGGFQAMRIVLRTGQPGYAPEQSVIASYEIDDYQTKAELTRIRLLTVLTAGIRAYDQIQTIMRSRAGLEMIVDSARELFKGSNLQLFARGVLTQITALLGTPAHGLVCLTGEQESAGDGRIIVAAGRFTGYSGRSLKEVTDPAARMLLADARASDEPLLRDGYMAMHFNSEAGQQLSIFIEADCEIAPADLALLKLFSTNIAIGFENVALLEQLDRLAYIDPTLEVPNLNAFEVALAAKLAEGPSGRMALFAVDHYSTIVADYGLRTAQHLLGAIYDQLVEIGSDDVMVARVGDAAFALLGPEEALIEELFTAAVAKPFIVDDIEIAVTATTTVLDITGADAAPVEIMQAASSALLHARRNGRGTCVVYDADMRSAVERRVMLQNALKRALEHGDGLSVHLQPKVNLESREVVGGEALLRWTHEDAAISPAEFIPIAESCGLTQTLTDYVVNNVGDWMHQRQGEPLPVSVNLSMVDLNNPDFAKRLLDQVESARLIPGAVEFEVTEGIAMQEAAWAIRQVEMLKEAGFGIALDDFGTGYSSLGHFEKLPIDTLKIDRRFITPLEVRNARQSLAAIMLSMTQALNVDCVAEGIETEAQLQALMFLGCGLGQGYLFGRPVPIEEFDCRYLGVTVH